MTASTGRMSPLSTLKTPSGRQYGHDEVSLVKAMVHHGMLEWTDEPFTLKSGIKSHIYFHGRNDLTDNPQLMRQCGALIGRVLMGLTVGHTRQRILIGVPTAANGFAASVTHYTQPSFGFQDIGFRVMREKLKESHGSSTQRGYWVNGRPNTDLHYYATIENVVTSGASLLEALDRLESDGYPISEMPHLVFMDREQGGVRRVLKEGFYVHALFRLLDVVWALKELEVAGWDEDRYQAVKDEIEAHQVT